VVFVRFAAASLISRNAGSMLVHAHDGNLDHLSAPIAINCDRRRHE
jgi:hypothetical protein